MTQQHKVKTALVVEGGGMRGVFSAGVLNAFGEEGYDPFDLYIGVSAGACNLASHLSGQNDRNFDIILAYSITSHFINPCRFLAGGHYMDLDWLWDITIREYRLDLEHLFKKLKKEHSGFIVVATSMRSGEAMYLVPDEKTLEHYLKVSSSLPFFYRNTLYVDDEPATDGGIADSIPVREALNRGAVDITVIRSRPSDYVKHKSSLSFLFPLFFRRYPVLAKALQGRYINYMRSVDIIKKPPQGVCIHEIAPPGDVPISRTSQNREVLQSMYDTGREYGAKYIAERKKSLKKKKEA